jgi:hypothetical protein
MKTMINHKMRLALLLPIVLILLSSCASPIKLTSSWGNKQAEVKKQPVIMVMVLGKANSATREDIENNIVGRLKKEGFKAVPATGIFQPGVKHDSAELVSTLRKNSIDMLITNAVVSRTENERFIPGAVQGTDIMVPAGGAAAVNNGYYYGGFGYNSYYNYYNANNSYQVIDAPKTPGTTVTDVHIVIESNLYIVATPQMIWTGHSTSTTKEPTASEINGFSKEVISDIKKYNLLLK